jgi:hypothetical protein
MNSKIKVNLACCDVFVTGDKWVSLDNSPFSFDVRQANFLGCLSLPDGEANLVYSSHFLEPIPCGDVPAFLTECRRIIASGGVLRLILPDLENLCRAFLDRRAQNEHQKADFIFLEMIDQCVRHESGGELGRKYNALKHAPEEMSDLINFVRERTGENLLQSTLGDTKLLRAGGATCTTCVGLGGEQSVCGRDQFCVYYLLRSANKMSASLVSGKDTIGYGISSNFVRCFKKQVSSLFSDAKPVKVVSKVSRLNLWIWTRKAARVKVLNRCISRHANLSNLSSACQPLLERLA